MNRQQIVIALLVLALMAVYAVLSLRFAPPRVCPGSGVLLACPPPD